MEPYHVLDPHWEFSNTTSFNLDRPENGIIISILQIARKLEVK